MKCRTGTSSISWRSCRSLQSESSSSDIDGSESKSSDLRTRMCRISQPRMCVDLNDLQPEDNAKLQSEHQSEMHTHASVIFLSKILPVGTAEVSAVFVERVVYAPTVVVSLRLSLFEFATYRGLLKGRASVQFWHRWHHRENQRISLYYGPSESMLGRF